MFTKTDRKKARRKSIKDREFLIAVVDEDYEKVNRLITAENVDMNFKDRDECTALHLATTNGDLNVVKLLLESGAASNVKNIEGETPLDIAKRLNKLEIVKIFEISNNTSARSSLSQNQQKFSQNKICENRHGVSINPVHGNIYQLKVLMLFLYKGVACKYSFRLGTEIKEARKFDDLVFEYTDNGKKIYRLLQAKHKIDESKKITVQNLLTETNGDYSLVKYFFSYQASKKEHFFKNGIIKDVTICTNIDFDFKNLQENQVEVEKILENDNILDVQSESKEPTRYKFAKTLIPKLKIQLQNSKFGWKHEIFDNEIDDFLQHLVFAVNQPNEEELGDIVKNEISKEFDFITTENAYNKFFVQMLDWMKSRDKSAFWSYKDGKNLFDKVKKGLPIWYKVQDPIKLFTGRLEHLETLRALFQTVKDPIVCVSGLGGVGKSELAKKYIMEYSKSYDNKVVWINAENYQTLVDSFRQLACEKLGIQTKNADDKEKEIRTLVAETYQYFSGGMSLFVFDNSEMYKSQSKLDAGIDRFLPCLPKDCQKPFILITSRNRKWPKNVKVHILETFTEAEAKSFITKSLKLESEEQFTTELGQKLQLLPLALQQAVSYINAQNDKLENVGSSFQISDYFEKLSVASKEIFNFEFPNDSDNTYNHTIFTTWNVTLDALFEKENGGHALDLLNVASYFLPDNIPIDLLSIIITDDREKLASAIELLKQYSLVNVQHKTVNMHRLVQQITRLKLDDNKKEKYILQMVLEEIRVDHVNVKNIDHLMCLWSYCINYLELAKGYYTVAINIAEILVDGYRYDEAKEVLRKVKELLQKVSEDDVDIQTAILASDTSFASIHIKEGQYECALYSLCKIYEYQETIYRSQNEYTLKTMSNIVIALQHMNKSNEALQWSKEVLRAKQMIFGENHPATLETAIQTAILLSDEEEYDHALSILEQTCNDYERTLGTNDIATMRAKSSVALIYTKQHKYEEALKILQVTYDFKKQVLGENHSDTLKDRILIASVFANQVDKYALALEMYEEILKIKLGMIGENHPEIIELQINIAEVLHSSGEYDKSLEILRYVLQKKKTNLGSYHKDVFDNQLMMATVLADSQGGSIEELELLEDLLNFEKVCVKVVDLSFESIWRNNLAPNIRNRIVAVSFSLKNYDKALEHSVKNVEFYEKCLEENHPKVLEIKTNIGILYYHKKYYKKALEILIEVKEIQEMTFGNEDAKYKSLSNTIRRIMLEIMTFGNQFVNDSTVNNPFAAIQNYDFDAFKKLLQHADPNSQDQDGKSFLHIAAAGYNLEIVHFLIRRGVDVTRANGKGDTALHIAVSKNRIEIAGALLEAVDRTELNMFINAKTNTTGDTALHVASKNGFFKMMKLLLNWRAAYDIRNESNESPVDVARDWVVRNLLQTVEGHFQFAKTISKDPNELDHFNQLCDEHSLIFLNARNANGYNLLQVGVINNHRTLVGQLSRLKDKIQSCLKPTFDSHWDELLSLATVTKSKLGDIKCNEKTTLKHVRKLVKTFFTYNKGTSDPNIFGIEEMLALVESHENKEFPMELARDVIGNHVKWFIASICGVKLIEAAKRNDLALVTEYIEQDAYANLADDGGWTPLLCAAIVGNEVMTELLLAVGADVNCVTKISRNTSLHIAVNKGHLKVAESLLERCRSGHFVNARTEAKGSTAMHVAAKNGHLEMILLLLNYGAQYCLENRDGKTPMDLADDHSIKKFLRLIDELFESVAKGLSKVVRKIKALKPRECSAVVSARNDQGYNLADFARLKKHYNLSREIQNLIEKRGGGGREKFWKMDYF